MRSSSPFLLLLRRRLGVATSLPPVSSLLLLAIVVVVLVVLVVIPAEASPPRRRRWRSSFALPHPSSSSSSFSSSSSPTIVSFAHHARGCGLGEGGGKRASGRAGGGRRIVSIATTTTTTTTTTTKKTTALDASLLPPPSSALHSLDDVVSRGYSHLFPDTADYIRALSSSSRRRRRRQENVDHDEIDDEIDDEFPSAEEFLTSLSAEFVRASRASPRTSPSGDGAEVETSLSSSRHDGTSSSSSTPRRRRHEDVVVEATWSTPLVVAIAASAASCTYDPSRLSTSTIARYYRPARLLDGDAMLADVSSAGSAGVAGDGGGEGVVIVVGGGSSRDLTSTIPTEKQVSVSLTSVPTDDQQLSVSYTDDASGTVGSVVGGMVRREDILVGGESGSGLIIGSDAPVATVSDQSSLITDVDDGLLSISLPSQQLSDLNYDSLQHDGKTSLAEGFTAIDPGSSPMPHAGGSLSDSIKGQLDRLNLPHYHIELPTMTNPFLELSPSMQSALSSIKTASGASEEKLGGVLNTITRSFEDLSDRVADISHSFEGLSGPMAAGSGEVAVAAASDQSSLIADTDDQLSNSLPSQQLLDLNYDSLQHDGKTSLAEGFTAIDPGSSPMPHAGGSLSDSIKGQLDRLNLPHYHIELPTMTNPFLELSPSMQSALSSIKTASGASEEKLESIFNTITRSFEDLSDRVADISHSFEGLSGQMAEVSNADASGMNSLVNSLKGGASKAVAFRRPNFNVELNDFNAPNLPQLQMHLPTLPNLNIFDGTSDTVRRIGDASLSDFGDAVLSTFKFTGDVVVKFLDFIQNAISGTSVASSIAHAQNSVTTAIENASHAVVGALTKIGNMTIIEIVQDIMKLVIVITDVLLKIMNAILYVVSGKDGAAWTTKATTSIEGASSQLLAQATSTYEDFTHTSLAELAHSIGDYGHYVGGEFSTLVAALRGDVDGMSLVAVSLPDDVLDSLASAVQTAMSL